VEFDIVRLRDERLRMLYKERYDHRRNVLDWDYQWELVPIGSIVHKIHFREFRLEGLTFEVRDSSYSAPNRTMAAMCAGRQKGNSVMRRGFWGDVANGPYAATAGIQCAEKRLTNKRSDSHIKSSCDIAYFNMLSWLSEIETGVPFTLKEEDIADFEYAGSVAGGGLAKGFLGGKAKEGGALGALVEVEEEEGVAVVDEAAAAEEAAKAKRAEEAKAAKTVAAKMANLAPFKLKLLGGDWVDVQRKPRHQKAFEVMTISTHVAFIMGSTRLNNLLQPQATVMLETAKWLVEIRKQNRTEYAKKLLVIAKQLGWLVRDGGEEAIDGITHSEIAFAYDAEVAEEHIAALRENGPSEAGAAAPLKELTAGVDEAEDGGEAASGPDGGAAQPKAADMACLQISDEANPAEPPQQTVAAPPPLEKVSVAAGSVAQMDASSGKVCAITGEPAKYRDPISGLPYANLAAFKELRKRYPDPKAELQLCLMKDKKN